MYNSTRTGKAPFRTEIMLLAILTCISHAQSITAFDPPNSTYTIGSAINSQGQITGYFSDGSGNHGFLRRQNGTFVIFDVVLPNGFPPNAFPIDINDRGEITGFYRNETVVRSFLRQRNGKIVEIANPNTVSAPSASFTEMEEGMDQGPRPFCPNDGFAAIAINSLGQITGGYSTPLCHGFLRQPNGANITFVVPTTCCMPTTQPQAINLFGQITGFFFDLSGSRGFLRQPDGSIVRFDPPDSVSTIPQAINLIGQIAGYYQDANFVVHGFLRQPNGTIISFDPVGSTKTEAKSINAAGQVTGFYLGADGTYHGFVRKLNGTFVSFDARTSEGTFAQSINLFGQITGYFFDGSSYHSFVRKAD
jgi:hypothetical protein